MNGSEGKRSPADAGRLHGLEVRCRAATTTQREMRRRLCCWRRKARAISRTVGVEEAVASTWRNRFADQGLEGLKNRKRSGKLSLGLQFSPKVGFENSLIDVPFGSFRWG
jgi:hypothetical protein